MASIVVKKKPMVVAVKEEAEEEEEEEEEEEASAMDQKGKGKGKQEEHRSVFELLPREIIQQILYTVDPNTFDSLTLLNSKWHHASRSALLYAHQLRCCGLSDAPQLEGEPSDEALPGLIRRFTKEARRELFESILRPEITEIQLICEASSSAAAMPGGEAFRFEFSPQGRYLLALSSSRIFVLDLSTTKVQVKRELKISKRPVSAVIMDDGSFLAVLSSNHSVTLYDLTGQNARLVKSLPLENAPRAIALSPGAEVLGAAYDGGIEVYSLHLDAVPTDRRAVNCDSVDSLAFSSDGTILLGTTLGSKSPTTVIVSAQFFSTDMPVEGLAQLWTTQVLFPRSSRDSSHATLLQGDQAQGENTWTFTYDRVYETFRAVRVDDLRNGHTYFTGPSDEELGIVVAPTTLPAPTGDGRMVVAGFGCGKVWIYGVPGRLDLPLEGGRTHMESAGSVSSTPERSNSTASQTGSGGTGGQPGAVVVPQWQVLCDKLRNVFIRGREIGEIPGLSAVKFVKCENGTERLVAVAGGGLDAMLGDSGEDEYVAIGGGRVILYDFARGPRVGEKRKVIMEIGNGIQVPVETLEEEKRDIEVEVAIVRRRTVAQRKNNDRRQTSGLGPGGERSGGSSSMARGPANSVTPTGAAASAARRLATATYSPGDDDIFEEGQEVLDLPYSHMDPRSRTTLNRAATAARNVPQAADRNRYLHVVGPGGTPLLQSHQSQQIQVPRGEDADWMPPPPPYTPRSDHEPPLPAHLLYSLSGPPRINTAPSSPSNETSPPRHMSTLERTRSNVGSMMRRPSVFRLTTNHLSAPDGDISGSRSAPVSPAVGRSGTSPNTAFTGPTYIANRQYIQEHHSLPRRGSAGDLLNRPHTQPSQPQYSQPQYGQPQYGQPQYGQPQYGRPEATDTPPNRSSPHHRPPPTRRPVPAGSALGRSPSRGRRGQLSETYTASSPMPTAAAATVTDGTRRNPSLRGSGAARGAAMRSAVGTVTTVRSANGSLRRNYSRAERSAAMNVRDARRRRIENIERSRGGGGGHDGKNCVIM